MTAEIINFEKPEKTSTWKVSAVMEVELVIDGLPINTTDKDILDEFSKVMSLAEDYLSGYKLVINQGQVQGDRIE